MSKTQAERAKAYRQKKNVGVHGAGDGQEQDIRDEKCVRRRKTETVDRETVTVTSVKRDENVTVERDGASRNVTEPERDENVTTVTKEHSAECETLMDDKVRDCTCGADDADTPVDPLDVYSEDRWTYLQSRGHTWNQDKQRGVRADGLIGVVVPGDPAYGPVVGGKCRSCGGPVQHQVIVKCLKCCTAGVPNAPADGPVVGIDRAYGKDTNFCEASAPRHDVSKTCTATEHEQAVEEARAGIGFTGKAAEQVQDMPAREEASA